MVIERGSVWWLDLGERRDRAPAYRRPVVVIQSDAYNRSALGTCVVATITSKTAQAAHPGNVFLPVSSSPLDRDSVVNVTQITTIDREGLISEIGGLPAYLLEEVDRGLRKVLGL
ncbi:MAG: type II toxin-antitoxin system PemK/MazF family toxin [Herbiconiux sp.]|nr:type II toxin-antitoxin system PemK/MazF family toxin [Herbiconiux sp.]